MEGEGHRAKTRAQEVGHCSQLLKREVSGVDASGSWGGAMWSRSRDEKSVTSEQWNKEVAKNSPGNRSGYPQSICSNETCKTCSLSSHEDSVPIQYSSSYHIKAAFSC